MPTKPKTPAKKPAARKKKPVKRKVNKAKQPTPKPSKKEKRGKGHPTDYREEYAEVAYRLCLLGATDKGLADVFAVTEQTINNWKQAQPHFFESITRGKRVANAKVANALFERACGYSHPEDKIMQYEGQPVVVPTTRFYPPDTPACSLWLRNREPELWRDKVEIETTDNSTLMERMRAAKERLKAAGRDDK